MQNGTTTTTTAAKEPARQLSPAELAEELMDLAQDCIPYELEDELDKAKEAADRAQAKVDRAGDKKLRILRAKSIEEAQTILDENPADANLKALCQRRSGWKPLQEKGASDEDLNVFLNQRGKGWPDDRPYPRKVPSAQVGWGGSNASVWVDPDKDPDGKAHLTGQKLVDAVRRVMGIPKPAAKPVATTPKKSAPKKPAAGKAKPKAPATSPKPAEPDAGGDDDEPAGGDPDAPIADSPEFDGLDAAAATLHAAETAWEEGPDAIENRSTFDANFERMQKATDALRAFLPLAVTPERAFALGLGTLVHETPWFKSLGVTDQARVSAMLSTQGNAKLLHPLIRDGATNAQIQKALGRVLGISGGGSGGKGISYTYKGGEAPQITANGRTYKGEALIEKTRELLGIGAPGTHPRADKPVLPSVAALSKPQTPMPTPEDEDAPPIPQVRIGGLTWRRERGGDEWWAANTAGVEGDADVLLDFVVMKVVGGWSVAFTDKGLLPKGNPPVFETENYAKAWCEQRNAELKKSQTPAAAPLDTWDDDPNVDGRGIYVSGVQHLWVRGQTPGDKAKIVIRVARGADGMYRTGHLLEFVGAQAWQADSDEPVKVSSQEAELEWYAVKARANILINLIKAAPGKPGGGPGAAWSPEQRQTYNAAIKALELFIAHNPACRAATPAKPKPKAAIVA